MKWRRARMMRMMHVTDNQMVRPSKSEMHWKFDLKMKGDVQSRVMF